VPAKQVVCNSFCDASSSLVFERRAKKYMRT
jgi:hypothetical protein